VDPAPPDPDPTAAADRLYERVLVVRAQAGDPAAFAELTRRYHPRLRYFLRKLAARPDAADDLLQDVWFDAYRGLPRLAEPGAFAPWLYRIARARVGRSLRGRRPAPDPLPDPAPAGPADDPAFGPDEVEQVHAALDRLTPAHREVLVLRFVEDMSYEDIARATGCTPGTVRSRLHYAKRALRGVIEGENGHDRT
jgi:RNA polymerase sigma-70 factor, ECF subfamily